MSILAAVLPLLLLSAYCRANPIFGDVVEPQIEEEENKINYRLPDDVKPVAYDIHITPVIQEKNPKFDGVSVITIQVEKKTNTITLHSKGLNIDKNIEVVTTDKAPVKLDVEKHEFDEKRDFLIITLKKELVAKKQYKLTLKYSAELGTEELYGFYMSSYKDDKGKSRYLGTTHFEPTGARQAFPCWDEPALKATFKIKISHNIAFHALSNMKEKRTENKKAKTAITEFDQTPEMSTYLVAYVVSDYVKEGNDSFRVWTRENAKDMTSFALEMGQKELEQLSKYTGIAYSKHFKKMDQISIPTFPAGAMENWGLVTYTESALLYDDKKSTIQNKQRVANVISHEFAHQWFGNLVSPKWWNYLWLNEGFATYFEYYITDKVVGKEWRLMDQMVTKAMQGNAFVADARPTTRAMNADVESVPQIRGAFDSIAYQKAGSVIRMMSHFLTEDAFQKGLKEYLKVHEKGTADSDDLFNALQTKINKDVLPKNFQLEKVMDNWVNRAGYPVVTVSRNNTAKKIVVSQNRYMQLDTEDDTEWWIPLNYATEKEPDFSETTATEWLKPDGQDLEITDKEMEQWVIFNKQQTGYYRVNYDDKNWDLITKYLKTDNYKKIHVINRAQLIDDIFNLARTGHVKYAKALDLASYLDRETDFLPWDPVFRAFTYLDTILGTSQEHDKLKEFVKQQIKKLAETVKYEQGKDDDHVTIMSRPAVLKWACYVGLEDCNKAATEKFGKWLEDTSKNSLDVNLKNNIVCAALRNANKETWDKALVKYQAAKDTAEKSTLLSGLGCTVNTDIVQGFLKKALEKDSDIDFSGAFLSVLQGSRAGADICLNTLMENYKQISEMDEDGSKMKRYITELGSRITNKDQYLKFGIFIARRGLSTDVSATGTQYASQNLLFLGSHQASIEEWLKSQDYSSNNGAGTLSITTFLICIPLLLARFY